MFPVCTINPIDAIDPIDPIDSKTETGQIRRAEQSGFRPRLDTATCVCLIPSEPLCEQNCRVQELTYQK